MAKLINPTHQNSWQISNYTHPEYPEKLKAFFQLRSANAILMRGSEGEPTASLQRLPEMLFLFANQEENASQEEHFEEPKLFPEIDANSTALITAKILSGKMICPNSILQQANEISRITGLN